MTSLELSGKRNMQNVEDAGLQIFPTKDRNYSIDLLVVNCCYGLLRLGGEVTLLTLPWTVIWGSLVACCEASGGHDASRDASWLWVGG